MPDVMPSALPNDNPGAARPVLEATAVTKIFREGREEVSVLNGVDIALAGGVLSIEVTDNGKGLSPEDLAKARSFGIRGLHERAETAGGWVDISSNPEGTTLILSVPLSGPENGFIDPLMPEMSVPIAETDPDDPTKWGTI